MKRFSASGFTLIELLVVIAIIGLLATMAVASVAATQKKARDTKRIAEIKQIQTALEMYKDLNGKFPDNTDAGDGAGGYDIGCLGGPSGGDVFIDPLRTSRILSKTVCDPNGTTILDAYAYYKYPAGSYGCDAARGDFYIFVAEKFESIASPPHPNSPGFACPARDWATAGGFGLGPTPAYVVGGFEN
ncbi:MAG: type II secretion system protein [Patescibacteria group bacterium]